MKKQFRLYDIYRTIAIGDVSDIKGILSYRLEVNLDNIFITICFNDGAVWNSFYRNERQLKELVRNVNKHLGNCRKPGKKKKER